MSPGRRVLRSVVVAVIRLAIAAALAVSVFIGFRAVAGSGSWPWWLVVIAAGVIAGVLALLRGPLDRLADRVVLGGAAGGYQLMRDLLARMASTLPVEEVVPRLAEAAGTVAHSPRAEVRLYLADGGQSSQVWPPTAVPEGQPLAVTVQHAGDAVGQIEVDVADAAASPFEARQLRALTGPAGLALSTVRLTYALRARLAELDRLDDALRASRDRLLTARLDEQRRMQADVDRAVVAHLAAALATLTGEAAAAPDRAPDRTSRRAAASAGREPDPLAAAAAGREPDPLAAAAAQVGEALDAVRSISRGIFPPRLADAGLQASLEGWAAHADVPVTITLDDASDTLHAVPDTEAALYFWIVTALEKLLARSGRDLSVTLTVREDQATIGIAGVIAAPPGEDDLTVAFRDRVEALDGVLDVVSAGGRIHYMARLSLGPGRDTAADPGSGTAASPGAGTAGSPGAGTAGSPGSDTAGNPGLRTRGGVVTEGSGAA